MDYPREPAASDAVSSTAAERQPASPACIGDTTSSVDNVTTAAVWMRVSTDEQRTENQWPELERFAKHHGYAIGPIYELDDSAWNGGKDGGEYKAMLRRALDEAWQGRYKVFIVWALDRLTRGGAEDALRLIRQFRERGCTVVSVRESWLNASPEVQDVLVAFAGWMGEQESRRRSERIRAGLARRKAEGLPIGGAVSRRGPDRKPRRTEGYSQAWARRRASE